LGASGWHQGGFWKRGLASPGADEQVGAETTSYREGTQKPQSEAFPSLRSWRSFAVIGFHELQPRKEGK
jgi:hypothetical protein